MANVAGDLGRFAHSDPATTDSDRILERRNVLMEAARRKIDPAGTGFDARMDDTDDSTFFRTDDVAFKDWWDWVEQVIRTISDGLTRVALGGVAAGFAIAASNMYGSVEGSRYAGATLLVAGAFGVLFLGSTVVSLARQR
jgi:hypothetical protein